ncbi:hypothetical protein BDY19DRAFT_953525 [Irpex rosettiformis]|uniref:Uncharacterized protein n=1 Tax=Irpex rosettiformis TaxID=378272 RepID=A0ACB8U114_9APHY|nr:hypothetical protein BDY19DRAFT_953525 [Irpex rosettiformis]
MTTYYTNPRPRVAASSSQPSHTRSDHDEQLTTLNIAGQSIYIFPTPSSLPAIPGGSSIFSGPSLFTDLSSIDVRSSISSDASLIGAPARLSPPNTLTDERWSTSPITSTVSTASDMDVEVWDWAAESQDNFLDRGAYRDFEEDTERVELWGIQSRQLYEGTHFQARSSLPFPSTNDFIDQHYHAFLRSRTQSDMTMSSSRSVYTPHPRLHIPLLSFFASLLFLDLDDPALRLLTQSSPDSVLFPGQLILLEPNNNDEFAATSSGRASPQLTVSSVNEYPGFKPHGLLRLLADNVTRPVAVIREGLAVIGDPLLPLANPFLAPGLNTIRNLDKFLRSTWPRGGRVWREVWLGSN